MSTLFDKALKLLFLLHQEFGAAFKEVTNVVLRTNIMQLINFGIQKTAHANFVKITSIKYVIHRTGYLSFFDASFICESLFRDRKAELSLFLNVFWWELVSYRNQSIDLRCKLVDCSLCKAWTVGISPDFWVVSFSLGARFLQIFGWVSRESAENEHFYFILFVYLFIFDGDFLSGGWVRFLYFARHNL